MQSRLLLNIVVRQGPAIFQLLSGEDETLLIWGNALLILDFGFDVLNGVRGFDFKGDSFTSQSLHKNLHTTSKAEHKMQSRFLLNVIVRESTAIFQLLSSEDKTLLIWGNALFILNFGLDVFNSIGRLNFQGYGLAS